jgi:GNAT superfamily N-acetyltransferase
VIAADLDGALAGVAAVHAIPLLEHTGWRGRLVALVVDETRRGRGVGRVLVTAAEAAAVQLGCREMEITSARDRAAAHSLYAGAGYDDVCSRAARFMKSLTTPG